MKKKIGILIAIIIFLSFGFWGYSHGISWYRVISAERARNDAIEHAIRAHQAKEIIGGSAVNPFEEDGVVNVLLIGLDKRVGQTEGHCDAIQLFSIDKNTKQVTITAVPRGTYSPLPFGKGATSSDYYVSNACGLGGLAYGIDKIEKILGQKADYLVVVGFSEVLGILRNLHLPTTETLQWLRQRQAYAIGEPQRARNHSTFLKQMLVQFVPADISRLDAVLQYIMYKTVKTDLSFAETQTIVETLSAMDLSSHPERIQLAMRPAHTVQDIPYVSEKLSAYFDALPSASLGSSSQKNVDFLAETQAKLLEIIDSKKNDPDFILWAFDNDIWLQVEDDQKRLFIQFDFLKRYILLISATEDRQSIIADYILEMEHRGEDEWAKKGRSLLEKEVLP